jgi:phytoene desaturase
MKPESIVVIGAGIGGLTAAIHMARAGWQVTVLEKNAHAGGRCDRFSREGHQFDTGPTLFVMPHLYEAEFNSLGMSIWEQLDLLRVDPTYHLVFEDGSQLALSSDLEAMYTQLEAVEPGSFQGWLRYLQEGERHYRLVTEKLVNREYRRASDFYNLGIFSLIPRTKLLVNHYRHMAAFFHAPHLKSAFTFQDLYTGLSPFQAPAAFSMMSATESAHGVWYPKGGMYRVVELLAGLAEQAGVEFRFNTPVERIQAGGGHVSGVVLSNGDYLRPDVVLANADLPYVYQRLLPGDPNARSIARKHFSTSAVSFFWGLDRKYEALGAHTLFLAENYRESFASIQGDFKLPANPSLYLHAPARLDACMAPKDQDTLIAIVPVGHLGENDDPDWTAVRDRIRQQVFRRLKTVGVDDLEKHIKFESSFTPPSWSSRYNLMKGATHGLSHRLTQMAYFRPSNRHPRYGNLYFTGASTHPGTGIPTAMVSGRLVSRRIQDETR